MVTICGLLSDVAIASLMRLGYAGPEFVALRQAMGNDPELAREARLKIVTDPNVERRDHITRWRNDVLRRALGDTHV